MCRLDGGTLAEIDDVAENSYLEAKTKLLGGNELTAYEKVIRR